MRCVKVQPLPKHTSLHHQDGLVRKALSLTLQLSCKHICRGLFSGFHCRRLCAGLLANMLCLSTLVAWSGAASIIEPNELFDGACGVSALRCRLSLLVVCNKQHGLWNMFASNTHSCAGAQTQALQAELSFCSSERSSFYLLCVWAACT